MKKDTFGAILKREIKSKGFTQEIFAEEIGVGHATLKKYLSPKYNRYPNVELLLKICAVLECDSDYLLGLQPHPRKETTDICSATGLSPAAIEALKIRRCGLDSGFESPDVLELKTLNFILEHGIGMDDSDENDRTIYMKETLFSYIGYILFSRFVDARTKDAVAKKFTTPDLKHHVYRSENESITFYDKISGTYTEFRIEDLNLSQMENIRKSIYLLKDEIDKKNRPSK